MLRYHGSHAGFVVHQTECFSLYRWWHLFGVHRWKFLSIYAQLPICLSWTNHLSPPPPESQLVFSGACCKGSHFRSQRGISHDRLCAETRPIPTTAFVFEHPGWAVCERLSSVSVRTSRLLPLTQLAGHKRPGMECILCSLGVRQSNWWT